MSMSFTVANILSAAQLHGLDSIMSSDSDTDDTLVEDVGASAASAAAAAVMMKSCYPERRHSSDPPSPIRSAAQQYSDDILRKMIRSCQRLAVEFRCLNCDCYQLRQEQHDDSSSDPNEFKCEKCGSGDIVQSGKGLLRDGERNNNNNKVDSKHEDEETTIIETKSPTKPVLKFSVSAILSDKCSKEGLKVRNGG